MKDKLKFLKYVAIVLVLACAIAFTLRIYSLVHLNDQKSALGIKAVKLLYNFGTVEQLDMQMADLYDITTKSVYNQLTIDNEERTLNTYLKFKNKTTTVNIIKATESYVLYTLKNVNISSDRYFVFMFDVNKHGKIDYVREVEAIDFVNTVD